MSPHSSDTQRRFVCPRCLVEFNLREAAWRDGEGNEVGAPRAIARTWGVRELATATWAGDPWPLLQPDLAAAADRIARDYHQVCPRGHRIPEALFKAPLASVALVGATSTGKSLYQTAVYHELLVSSKLADLDLIYGEDPSPETRGQVSANDRLLFHERKPLVPTRPGEAKGSGSLPPMFLPAMTPGLPNLLMFDADGSQTASSQQHVENNPALLKARVFFFFVPAANIVETLIRQPDDQASEEQATTAISACIAALAKAGIAGHDCLACVIVSKADRLTTLLTDDLAELTRDLDYRSGTLADIIVDIEQDSEEVRDFLRSHRPGIVARVEKFFGRFSYHFVSSTGCSSEVSEDSQRFPAVKPRRVLDPVLIANDHLRSRG